MIKDITIENIDECIDFLPIEVIGNLGRLYFHGIFSLDESQNCDGVLVWEERNVNDPASMLIEIDFFDARNTGVGERLLSAYEARIRDKAIMYTIFEMQTLSEDMKELFRSYGFKLAIQESRDIRVTLGEFINNIHGDKKGERNLPPYIVPIKTLSLTSFKNGLSECIKSGNTGWIEDIPLLPPVWYESDISSAVYRDAHLSGLLLIHGASSNLLTPQLIYASGPDSRTDLVLMVIYSVTAALQKYPEDTVFLFRRHDEKTKALATYLLPGCNGDLIVAGTRMERR